MFKDAFMRYFLLALIFGVFACDNEDDFFVNQDQKTYKLRAINVGLTGQIIYERGLDFSETITLKKDSTFIKERFFKNDTVLVSKGFYSQIRSNSQNFFKFEHNIENVLIQNLH